MSENPISELLGPLIHALFGCRWEEYSVIETDHNTNKIRTTKCRKCLACNKIQTYKWWRRLFFLTPWVDYD